MMRAVWLSAAAWVALGVGLSVAVARAQGVDASDYGIIEHVPRAEADAWLKDQITRRHGKIESDRYTFVLGFSTGHFGNDPVHAIAMRRLAFTWLNNTMAPGDRVIPVSWEMSVWDFGSHVTLTDDPVTRAQVVNQVPYAPMRGTRGGHDVERALFEVLQRVVRQPQAASTIVLMLTNTNQSTAAPGARLFGADNPQLARLMERLGYSKPPVRATFVLRSKGRPLAVDVTALFPVTVRGRPGGGSARRYPTFPRETWQPAADMPSPREALPNPVGGSMEAPRRTPTPVPAPERPGEGGRGRGSVLPVLIALVGLAAVAAIVLFALRRRPVRIAPAVAPAPAAEAEPPKPTGKPIPGALSVTIGTAATDLPELASANAWTVVRAPDGAVTLSDGEAPVGTPLAALSFDGDRRLRIEAQSGAQFLEIQPAALPGCDSGVLRLEPGKMVVCRIVSPGSADKVRIEVRFRKP